MTGDSNKIGLGDTSPIKFKTPSPDQSKQKIMPADSQKADKIGESVKPEKKGKPGALVNTSRKLIPKTTQEDKGAQLVQSARNSLKKNPSQSRSVTGEQIKSLGSQSPVKTESTKRTTKTKKKRSKKSSVHHPKINLRQFNAEIGQKALKEVAQLRSKIETAKNRIEEEKASFKKAKESFNKLKNNETSQKKSELVFKNAKNRLQKACSELKTIKQPIQTDSHGIETWEVTVKLNGEDHKVHVKEFPAGSYNGVKLDGFRVRQQLLFNASREWVQKQEASTLNGTQKNQALRHLDLLNQRFEMTIQKSMKTPEAKILKTLSNKHKFNKEFENTYNEINKNLLRKIAAYAKDTECIINNAAAKEIIDQKILAAAENEHVYNRSRPIIVNTFRFGPKTFVGIQTPARRVLNKNGERVNANTIPSTIRDRQGLVNYVTSSFGEIKNGEVTILSEGIRHSSYSPKGLEDAELRQTYACENVRSCLADIAERKLMALEKDKKLLTSTKKSPLLVSLRTMLLLTTGIGDTAFRNRSGGKWVGDAEGTQLRDSAFGLSVHKDRVFQVNLGRKFGNVWLKADISFINLGTNLGVTKKGIVGNITIKKKSEQMVNATGFTEFDKELDKGILDMEKTLGKEKGEISTKIKFLKKYSSEIRNLQTNSDLDLLTQDVKDFISDIEKDMYTYSTIALKTQKKITDDQTRLPGLRKKLNSQYKAIKHAQDKIGAENKNIVNEKRKLFLKNKNKINEYQDKLNFTMKDILKRSKINSNTRKLLETYRDVINNAMEAREVYYEKKYKNPGCLNDFQALYIETQQLLGNSVEFFCKSAEDRTGRVDDRVMERQVYKAIKGHAPRTKVDYVLMNTSIAPIVHQYSPSQDNTEQNSGARGEQVTGKANPEQSHLFNADRSHSQLAKKVFKLSKKLDGPSRDAQMVMKT